MYAIFRTAGKQFRAEPGRRIQIPLLEAEPGARLTFDEVLLGSDGQHVKAGTPVIAGAKVTAEVLRHGKEKKIIVFKFKRRKNYARKQGHRQKFTEIRIDSVELG